MNEIEHNLMFKFLKRNYPIHRLKSNERFKRAIILDNGSIYFLSDEKSHINLKNELIKIIKIVFFCLDENAKKIVKSYTNL
jgi:hypothetical protein